MADSKQSGELNADLDFHYRIWRPERTTGEALVLLHGSGVDETTMGPLGASVAPEALRIAVRGRIQQEGGWRWFARITPISFEQRSIVDETAAFAGFLRELGRVLRLDLGRIVLVGYSNGANLISSLMLLHPGLVRRAALLRAMPVLDPTPPTDLSGTRAAVITGERDITYAPFAPALTAMLRECGAEVEAHTIDAGHEFGPRDAEIIQRWLSRTDEAAG
jgi:phospholipase/carboxylesterase